MKQNTRNDGHPPKRSTPSKEGQLSSLDIAGRKITIVQGDIVRQETEAVVNAANSQLLHGGGVAGAISRAGGARLERESREWVRKNGEVPVGAAAVTSAGSIRGAKVVIHAVGPCVGSASLTNEHRRLLDEAMRSSLRCAEEQGVRSMAVPAISAGIYGFPVEIATKILVDRAVSYLEEHPESLLGEVRFVAFSEKDKLCFERALFQASEHKKKRVEADAKAVTSEAVTSETVTSETVTSET